MVSHNDNVRRRSFWKELAVVLVLIPVAFCAALWWMHRDDRALARIWARQEVMQPIAERMAGYLLTDPELRPEKVLVSGAPLDAWIPELIDAGLPPSLRPYGALTISEDDVADLSFSRRGLAHFNLSLLVRREGTKNERGEQVWQAEVLGEEASFTFSLPNDRGLSDAERAHLGLSDDIIPAGAKYSPVQAPAGRQ